MNRQDRLWKAILEEFFYEFLDFHYPEFATKVDLAKGFDFLDKDLPNIIPEAKEIHRKADKVVKVYLKDGTEQWIIVHLEIQGYKDPDFAKRMFIYYYRLWERFGKPIASLVIYSDKNKQNRGNKYEIACLNTSLVYNFDTYVIADHTIAAYEQIDNPIAIIYQVALIGLQKNLADEQLLEMKIQLFRKMYEKGYKKEQIKRLATFIKTYVTFTKKEFNRKFDEQTTVITKNRQSMGIIETVLEMAKEEGLEEGREQGLEIGKEEGLEIGKEIGKEEGKKIGDFLGKFQKSNEFVYTLLTEEVAVEKVVKFTKMDQQFILDFQKNITPAKYKVLVKALNILKDKLAKNYSVSDLKTDIAIILLKNHFSEKAISLSLKISPKKISTLKSKLPKK